jgi:hypothetical protein
MWFLLLHKIFVNLSFDKLLIFHKKINGSLMDKKWLCLSLLVIISLSSCSHKASTGRLVKRHDAEQTILQAKSLYNTGEIDSAIVVLQNFIGSKVYHSSHDQAYELIVEWLLQVKRRNEAKRIASYFLTNHQASSSAQKIIDLFEHDKRLQTELVDHSQQEVITESEGELLEEFSLRAE